MNVFWNYLESLYKKISTGSVPLQLTLKAVMAVFVAFVIWTVVKRMLASFEKRSRGSELIQISDQVFALIRKALFLALIIGAGAYLIQLLSLKILEKPFFALLIILIAAPVNSFLHLLLQYLEAKVAAKTKTKVDNIIFDLLHKFSGFIIYATAVILALDALGVNVMPFIAGAGVAGVAIGFAAKDTLSNLIAGVLLIIDRPFEIGDRIEVWSAPSGSATWGDVIDIGLRATRIKTTDNIVIIIPNNEIMTRDIVNYSVLDAIIRVRVNIGVSYEADIEKAKRIIVDVAKSLEWAAQDPAPKVVVRNFGESSVDLQLRVWILNARKRMDTISYVTDRVKAEFDKAGIEIPYPKRDIYVYHKTVGNAPPSFSPPDAALVEK